MAGVMQKKLSKCLGVVFTVMLLMSTTFYSVKKAEASYCVVESIIATPYIWWEAMENFDYYLDRRFKELETFLLEVLWQEGLLPVMMEAAKEFSAVALQQSMMVGMFIDAESQMNAQLLLQEIRARVNKDYKPSLGMCEFGSLSKSLAATEMRSEIFPVMFSRLSQERQLGKGDTEALYGKDFDHKNRVLQFGKLFCNEKDRGSALEIFCKTQVDWGSAGFDAAAKERMNKDIDYFSLMELPLTMKLDLTNQVILDTTAVPEIHDEDEEHLMALSANLFGHSTFTRIPPHLIANNPNVTEPLSEMQKLYIDTRSIVAKRSVAENSLYAIAALKASSPLVNDHAGGADDVVINSRKYIEHILKELGIHEDDRLRIIGDNPSYYAQMEVLTKKLYQNPNFYVNLYDTPANVERKTVALQAIKLMQKFDMLKSYLRGEATVSILLEVAVSDLQKEIEDQIQAVGEGG